ncbi:hypothetical protein EUTSA_v10009437mg [Eutrema salsugineum]|uniref:F-box domain-containing protein n=1 Tax=Eutrema salsugineum TaxID=72664 RepID=V4L1U9_EUTSA|nr:hypothetical protein EUTSA_v10009437mg [Eutrema salsugineum]
MDSIPTDLVLNIFSRLHSKSIVRFRCLSKLWGSKLHHPYFTDLFLTILDSSTSLIPPPRKPRVELLLFSYKVHVIYNPSTGQCASLPELRTYGGSYSFLGFDPIDKQFKVFSVAKDDHRIRTLGTKEMTWRKVQCPLTHYPYLAWSKRICINGVLYYVAEHDTSELIVCFDVRSEKFKFIEVMEEECFIYDHLINYKGKLGGIFMNDDSADRSGTLKLCLRVLEDVEEQKWSEYVYTLQDDKIEDWYSISVVGVTATGEILLSKDYTSKPYYVFYFSPERNTLQSVEIQGFGEYYEHRHSVSAFIDYVEDLNFL